MNYGWQRNKYGVCSYMAFVFDEGCLSSYINFRLDKFAGVS